MFLLPPKKYRKRRNRKPRPVQTATLPLTLVSAEYTPGSEPPNVLLTFNQAISIAEIDPGQVVVDDSAINHLLYTGASAELVNPAAVRIELSDAGLTHNAGVKLSASENTGIVASGDGAVWAGVTDVELPFA